MILLDHKEKLLKFIICINLLLLVLLAAKSLFNIKGDNKEYNSVSTSIIKSETETTSIYVEYPRFGNNDEINKIITDMIYEYIKEFKTFDFNKSLDISYKLYYVDDFVNIAFHIENTLSQIKNKNLLINLKTNEISNITALFDENYLKNEIDKLVFNKYEIDIYNKIISEDLNNFTYIIDSDTVEVYFNNKEWEEFDYTPYIIIDLNENITYSNNNTSKNKYIAFTYDDGPSEYTEDILAILNSYKVSATFFVNGKNIEGRESIIKKINKSRSEVASHGYSHTNFNTLSKEELQNEINSSNALMRNITGENTPFIRPPYGEYNENLLDMNYDVILWNINSKDWIVRNSNKIYNNVINNACDGCIVLMHDTYKETLEATKRLIPALKKQGYTIVSVSKLMNKKGFEKGNNSIINYIK